ncbi:integrase [Paracoccus pantotrophus]|uniref:Integrase n=1 Tax=Paracoccus pantotrophus TaxID=82367 RepID=A0AAE6NY61_PARPN|nr:integrase [Paracoccus pantotrophus]RDD95079.1 integrase [Paracoccus pantotrophus]RNI19593.1 integrase [Paracoccus pantotrophus]WGR65751.1 integrase [Paracoccus pantotrophus]
MQLLKGHTKMDSTVRYLGVDFDNALTLSEGIDL